MKLYSGKFGQSSWFGVGMANGMWLGIDLCIIVAYPVIMHSIKCEYGLRLARL